MCQWIPVPPVMETSQESARALWKTCAESRGGGFYLMCQEGAVGETGYTRKIEESNLTHPALMLSVKWKYLRELFPLGGYCDCSLYQQHLGFCNLY